MNYISNQELKKIKGGFSVWAVLGIAAIISFLAGVISGYVNPQECGGE